MIDFNKLNITYLCETNLLENNLIDWHQSTNLQTGEMIYPIRGKYNNINIKVNPTRKELNGSIHKLYNILNGKGDHNHNDFNFNQIVWTIKHLKNVLSLDLNKTIIENLEIGLNIETTEDPTTILNDNLIVWSYKEPTKNNEYNGKGKYIEFETSQYYFKIYNKGKQYETGTYILRIEAKIIRNETLKKIGLSNLQDLSNKAKITALLEFLYQSFDSVVMVDKNPLERITDPKEKEIIQNGINPKYWISINGMKRKRFKDKFDDIIEKHELNQTYKEIKTKLKNKGQKLLECYEMNDFENKTTEPEKDKMLRNEPYIYIHNVTSKKCIITGVDITHQKDDSHFLSENSIMKIYETDSKEFERLNKDFGPKTGDAKTLNEICYYIAHNIRNRDSNKRHEVKRKIVKYQNSLFPLDPTIDLIDNRYLNI
jgi:hypothetical protein